MGLSRRGRGAFSGSLSPSHLVAALGATLTLTLTLGLGVTAASAGNRAGAGNVPAATVGSGGTWVANAVLPKNTIALGPIACASADDCVVLGTNRGPEGIWATTDGGRSWVEQVPPHVADLESLACAPGTESCWAVGRIGDNQGAVIDATTDAGASWAAQVVPFGLDAAQAISCPDALHCVAVGAAEDGFQAADAVTSNGGATWVLQAINDVDADFLVGVSCATTDDCTAIGFVGGSEVADILATTDGGSSWHDEYISEGQGEPPWSTVSCPTALDCYVVGTATPSGEGPTSGLILSTKDGGAKWVNEAPPRGTVLIDDVSCPSSLVCWATAATSDQLPAQPMTTDDGGATWSFAPAAVADGVTALSCPTGSACSATDEGPDVLSTRDATGTGCTGSVAGGALIGMAPAPDGGGYWLASAVGGLLACGDAPFYGSPASEHIPLAAPIVGIAAATQGCGYYLLTRDGTVYPFGPCALRLPSVRSSAPFVGIATDPTARGYWLVSADGGVFALGAPYRGSVPGAGVHTSDVVGVATSPTGDGYWLVGSDGGVFSFGLPYHGSLPGIGVAVSDIAAIVPSQTGAGYLLAGADGGVFAFGAGVRFCGSATGRTSAPVAAAATFGFSPGYWLVERDGQLDSFDAPFDGTSITEAGHPQSCG